MNPTTTGGSAESRANRPRRPLSGEREKILAEWAASGKAVTTVAAETGWSEWTLYRWRERARRGESNLAGKKKGWRGGLVAVPAPVTGAAVAELTTRSGVVRFFAPASPTWAAQFIRELSGC